MAEQRSQERRSSEAVTAFPSQVGAFPAVTFFAIGDAISYAMSFSPTHGACTCPAESYTKHHVDTVRA